MGWLVLAYSLAAFPVVAIWWCCKCVKCAANMIYDTFNYSGISSDWASHSGSWSNPTGAYLQTSSTNAVLLHKDTLRALSTSGMTISCKLLGEPVSTKMRIVFGWQDDSNYYAAELFAEDRLFACGNGNVCTAPKAFVKIIKVIGGVESDVSSESHFLNNATAEDWTLTVCYKESSDPAEYNAQVTFVGSGLNSGAQYPPSTKCHLNPLGRRFGLGTGDTVTSPAKFDLVIVNCPRTCTFSLPCGCLPLTAPNSVDLSMSGTGCALAGPLVLSKGSSCFWYYVSGSVGGCVYSVYLQIYATGADIGASLTIYEYHTATGFQRTYFDGVGTVAASTPGDCAATIAITATTSSIGCCTSGSVTATITATP